MSVILKGMWKPKKCEWIEDGTVYRCPLLDIDDDCKLQDCDHAWTWEEQMKDCPLIELPEKHGRLIDAELLCNDLTRFYDGEVAARTLVYEQPIVVEEEG